MFFRLVVSPGLKQGHRAQRKLKASGGPVRVCSELLVEKNKKMFKGNIEAPSCWPIYPVDGEPGAQASAQAD